MNTYMKTNILCWGLLCALSLTACSEDTVSSRNLGTTEEKNAFWNQASNLTAWTVMNGSEIKLDASKKTLAGRVSLAKAGDDGLSRAGVVFDAADPEGSAVDLSESSGGLCIAYGSDFDVEVRIDDADYTSSSMDKDLPYASFSMKDNGNESRCVSWDEFKKNKSDLKDDSFAKKVRSVQIVFVGKSGSTGEFDIQRLAPYVRWEMWWGKTDGDHVNTGFKEGDEGTSGEWSLFGDTAKAHIEFSYGKFEPGDAGYEGNVVFDESSSNPDVGIQFLVAGKSTEKGKDVIHSADVSTKWKGLCLEYESQMDIEMQLVPENASEENILKLTFAKNNDLENRCNEFADVPNSDQVLNKLAIVRLKFIKENNSGTNFVVKRVSYLLPEDLAVKDVGEYKDVKPTESSDYKSGKSFLWDGAIDGDHVDLGIENATSGGNWVNSALYSNDYSFGFPDDVEDTADDDNANVISTLVDKYHKFTAYVKTDDGIYDLDRLASIGFNTVSSKQEAADVSAWGGFCVHYKTNSFVRVAIITDVAANKYWYADVDYSDDMVWGKISWDAFKNVDKKSKEKIEDAVGKITAVQLQFPVDGGFDIDKFGSYDQCGK